MDENTPPALEASTRTISRPASPTAPASPRRERHTKGLLLNFPILVPTSGNSQSHSPRTTSPSLASERGTTSPHIKSATFDASGSPTRSTHSNTDILTLVATQERKVLELREELARAEKELESLKKQWVIHEAGRKREEVRLARRLPVPLDDVAASPNVDILSEAEEERRRRRVLTEMSHNVGAASTGGLARRGSQRKVFEGRHTRTLSLLSPTTPTTRRGPDSVETEAITQQLQESATVEADQASATRQQLIHKQSLSPMPTLDGFVSPDALQLGKSYKDFAAQHRHSLPPAAAEVVKHGKNVVEGVRDGLWNFLEDLRQATVGEEALREWQPAGGPSNGPRVSQAGRKTRTGPAGTNGRTPGRTADAVKEGSSSFWGEFGLDTPGKTTQPANRPAPTSRGASAENGKPDRRNQRKSDSSTESKNPPDLLADLAEEGELDEWEAWESPSPLIVRKASKLVELENVEETATVAAQVVSDWQDFGPLQSGLPDDVNEKPLDNITDHDRDDIANKPRQICI